MPQPAAREPRHDPAAPNALVLQPATPGTVAVVLDPFVARSLQPHQREGVAFMWRCISGGPAQKQGVILADEMGLGKTLQAIALIWTAIKQSDVGGSTPLAAPRRGSSVCG